MPSMITLSNENSLALDMDSLFDSMENGMFKFITASDQIKTISIWSSLVKIEDVDELRCSKAVDDSNLLHSSIGSFFQRIQKFKKEHPSPPLSTSLRGTENLSIDHY